MSATYENHAFTLYRLYQSEAIFILDVVDDITPLQPVRAVEQKSDSALMVIRKVLYFINVGINIGTESEQFYEIPSDDQIPESGLDHSPNIRFKFANINVSNVAMNLSNLKVSKATGMDNLRAKILKISSYLIAPSLTAIFNMSLKSGIYI